MATAAGGFIGRRLTTSFRQQGDRVRDVDVKPPEFGPTAADEFELIDLRRVLLGGPRDDPEEQLAHQPLHAPGRG